MDEAKSDARPPDPLAIRRRTTPDRVGVTDADSGEEWTYADLDDAADAVATRLRETVDATTPSVGLLFDTRPAVFPLAFGGVRAGVRVGLLDVALDEAALADRIDLIDADLVICEGETASLARAATDCPVASIDEPRSSDCAQFGVFGDRDGRREPDVDPSSGLGDLVAFTSGTTGTPKGVRLPIETLVASAIASALRLGVAADDRWLVPIPTYHVGGFSPFVRCTQAGTSAVLQREFEPTATVDAIDRLGVTCVSLVPTQLSRMLDIGWEPPARFRFALVGGGPVPPELLDRCEDREVPICPTYGATETASQVATALPETAFANPGTVGPPLAFTDVTIVDEDGPCQPGASGEVVVDGPTVTPGYVGESGRSNAFDDRGFHTGDEGRLDEEGRLWIDGRLDDRIVTGGENVSANAVADALEAHPAVVDAAVVGIDDPEWGERVAALVVAAETIGTDALRDHCRTRLPHYAVPKTIEFADALPRTSSGTVDRTAVERRLH